jgi:hypothetical protein
VTRDEKCGQSGPFPIFCAQDSYLFHVTGVYTFHAALTLLGKQFLSFINKSREDA